MRRRAGQSAIARAPGRLALLALLLVGCNQDDNPPGPDLPAAPDLRAADARPRDARRDRGPRDGRLDGRRDAPETCPSGTVQLKAKVCIDLYEAPNAAGASPLVMYSFTEAEAWCKARSKRLCYDDEWTLACASSAGLSYPYGNTHQAGVCNDDKVWRTYDQSKLNGWPPSASSPTVGSLSALIAAAKAVSSAATVAADHVMFLYQAEPSGSNTGCKGALGVFDLCGNVEEWTRRRDADAGTSFSGALKGRYWAEARTCQSAVLVHANAFRFYEIGFRCCKDLGPT